MNCREFTSNLIDLARGDVAEGVARHADSCAACAERLAQQRALSAGLRVVALSDKAECAPPSLEAALLESFRARHAGNITAATTGLLSASVNIVSTHETNTRAQVIEFKHRRAVTETAAQQRWWLKVAAALLVAVGAGLIAAVTIFSPQPAEPSQLASAGVASDESAAGTTTSSEVVPASVAHTTHDTGEQDSRAEQASTTGTLAAPERAASNVSGDRRARIVNAKYVAGTNNNGRVGAGVRAGQRNVAASVGAETAPGAGEQEIATEYMSMPGAGTLGPLDGGHVVRVEVPRATLASFGLPLSGGAGEMSASVKADVLLGNDGIARAIRFVR